MDTLSRERRSWNMSRIKSRDTEPERIVRSTLHRLGFRFRLHVSDLPGRPDIVLPKLRAVIFVHGCFWHRHHGCRLAYEPKSRVDFWRRKFTQNVQRDQKVRLALRHSGRRVFVVWECETRNLKLLTRRLTKILDEAGIEEYRAGHSRQKPQSRPAGGE
jgi:DNA mismatch endonuclease (patch repair protein)